MLNDKGEKGDANEAVIKALIDAGKLLGARPPQASIPAFLALEEAGDLPQHARNGSLRWTRTSPTAAK